MKKDLIVSTIWKIYSQTSSYGHLISVSNHQSKGKELYVCIYNRTEGFIETDAKNMISQKGVFR